MIDVGALFTKPLFDTNVLFSALGFRGVPGLLLEELVRQGHSLVTSDYILNELRETVQRKFRGRSAKRPP
jgi:predicted nucleic acid-binding protein